MTMKTIACTDCGEAVPYGRLSCPACGALLASVTGGRPRSARTADAPPPPAPEPEKLASSAVAVATAELMRSRAAPAAPNVAAEREAGSAAADAPTDAAAEPNAAPVAVGAVATRATAAGSRLRTIATRTDSDPEPSDEPPTPWAPLERPAPVLTGRPYQRHVSLEPGRDDLGCRRRERLPAIDADALVRVGVGSGSSSGTSAAATLPVRVAGSMSAGSPHGVRW